VYTLTYILVFLWVTFHLHIPPQCESESTKIKEKVELRREKSYQIRWSDRQHVLSWWIRWKSDLTFSQKKINVYIVKMSLSCLLF